MMLGESLLVAAVVEPGQRARSVYLPGGSGWYDFWSGDYYTGGQEVVLTAPWDRPPLLAKEGCAIPLNAADQHFAKPADERGFAVFPKRNEGTFECECFEDDGESQAYREGNFRTWHLEVKSSSSELLIQVAQEGKGLRTGQISFLFPRQERRPIRFLGGLVAKDALGAANRELLVTLPT
jgi:alpha-glucosidase